MASQPQTQSTAVAVAESAEAQRFGLMQRQARMFAMSPLVPEHLRKGTPEQAMANCYIAMTIADRMGEDRMTVMQNIHIVSGKAGFASQYMIARANSSGVFKGGINWRIDRADPNNLRATAYATLAETGEEVEFTCDMDMARAEQWVKNAKYKSMPEVMLRYRSAAFLVRFYAPHVMLGYQTADEVEDVFAANVPETEPLTADMLTDQSKPAPEPEPEAVEEAEAEPVEESATEEVPADELGDMLDRAEDAAAEPEPESEEAAAGGEGSLFRKMEALSKEEPTEAEKRLALFRARIEDAETDDVLAQIDADWVKAVAAYDKATAEEIEGLIAAKRAELAG